MGKMFGGIPAASYGLPVLIVRVPTAEKGRACEKSVQQHELNSNQF